MGQASGTEHAAVGTGGTGSPPVPVSGDLYAEVMTFYAWQMRRVDALDIEGFAGTFTDDGEIAHSDGQRQRGKAEMLAGMRAALPRYRDITVRHWFGHVLVEPDAGDPDTLRVSYYSLVALTDREGKVRFQPTFTVDDVLVRRGGRLLTRSRLIRRDTPAESV
ncbi:nuclear transport factor 2 family protein [Streptomyces sp. rh34]|uniref:nuclear transport factor 2 family protein n=1 Tax=Streptomyces sp. rh34 TaxID=2034272 RepID=UPI000BF0A58B|nr:nuclear transport factor 2 family protein [Streptomyces sp. rh34]